MRTTEEFLKEMNGAKVVGMRKLYYLGQEAGDEMFEYDPATCVRYEIFVIWNRNKYIISVCETYGWCGSGYTTASFGEADVEHVYEFGPFTHRPKDPNLTIQMCDRSPEDDIMCLDYCCNVFEYSYYGFDEYYPSGLAFVDEDLFIELPRAMKRRPVWLFHGDSGAGKSTLAMLAAGKLVYETDSNPDLPDVITEDIVVIGNKYKFEEDDIISRLFDNPEVIRVEFTKVEK